MKNRLLFWGFGLLGLMVFGVMGCDSLFCKEGRVNANFPPTAKWARFGRNHIAVKITEAEWENCTSFAGGGDGVDYSRYFLLGIDTNEIIEIKEKYKELFLIETGDIPNELGELVLKPKLGSSKDNYLYLGAYRLQIHLINGEFVTFIFDPYSEEQFRQVGKGWGKEWLSREQEIFSPQPWVENPIRPWSGDSVLIALTDRRLDDMDENVNHYYLQNVKDGTVSVMDFKGNNGGRWNDVINVDDSIYTIKRRDDTTAILYRFYKESHDSVIIDLVENELSIDANDSGKGLLFFDLESDSKFTIGLTHGFWAAANLKFESNTLKLGSWEQPQKESRSEFKTVSGAENVTLFVDGEKKQIYDKWTNW